MKNKNPGLLLSSHGSAMILQELETPASGWLLKQVAGEPVHLARLETARQKKRRHEFNRSASLKL